MLKVKGNTMSIGGVFIGIILIGIGVLTLRFNQGFAATLGTPRFVWKYFGPGREYSFYKLVSILIIILGFFVMFGLFGTIANLILKPFRGLINT